MRERDVIAEALADGADTKSDEWAAYAWAQTLHFYRQAVFARLVESQLRALRGERELAARACIEAQRELAHVLRLVELGPDLDVQVRGVGIWA